MRLEQSFEVPVPVAQAWSVLLDVERIAPCMPGATLTGFDGTAFTGVVKVKLGPISLAYKGNGRFTERDEPGKRVVIVASGQDSRGAGGAQARVTAVLHDARGGSATLVKVLADVDIAGKAAQFGRGLIADVSANLVKQFADCLAQKIASEPVPAAAAAMAAAPAAAPIEAPAPLAAPEPVAEPPAPPVTVPAAAPVFIEPTAPPEPAPVAEPVTAPEPAAEPEPAALEEPPAPTPEPTFEYPVATPAPPAEPEPFVEDYKEAPEPAPDLWAAEPEPERSYPVAEPVAQAGPVSPAPEPVAPPPATVSHAEAAPVSRPAPEEAEPIDLLAVTGAKGMLRRAAPVLIVVGLVVIALIVWLAVA